MTDNAPPPYRRHVWIWTCANCRTETEHQSDRTKPDGWRRLRIDHSEMSSRADITYDVLCEPCVDAVLEALADRVLPAGLD